MRKLLPLLIAALLLTSATVFAQQIGSTTNITAQDAGSCATAGACATFSIPVTLPQIGFQVSGFGSATLTIEATIDGTNWVGITCTNLNDLSTVTTVSAAMQLICANAGFSQVRLRGGTWASGTIAVYAARGYGTARVSSPTFVTVTATNVYATNICLDATNKDTCLVRDAANTLALKNGTTAQAFRVYGTTTGPVYSFLLNDGSTAKFGVSGGTGNIEFVSGGTTILQATTSGITVGTGSGTGPVTALRNSIATTPSLGLAADNQTSATSGVPVQYSPYLQLKGRAWDTSASETVEFREYVVPANAATPTGTFKWDYSLNGAAASTQMSLTSAGALTATATITGTRHLSSTSAPSLTSCGTGTIDSNSNDFAGKVTATGATACTVTFTAAYPTAAWCVITDDTTIGKGLISAQSASAFTVSSLTSGDAFTYVCGGK